MVSKFKCVPDFYEQFHWALLISSYFFFLTFLTSRASDNMITEMKLLLLKYRSICFLEISVLTCWGFLKIISGALACDLEWAGGHIL